MADNQTSKQSKHLTMADLLATSFIKPLSLERGDEVEGEIVALTGHDVILDLGAKAEGVLSKRDLPQEFRPNLKVGEKLKAYVSSPESESGQIILSYYKPSGKLDNRSPEQSRKWQRFIQALEQKKQLRGRVVEFNKGGLMVEVEGSRGFLPTSQISLKYFREESKGLSGLVDKELPLLVIEADPKNNRLVFSARERINEEERNKLEQFTIGEKVQGKVVAVSPSGLLLDIRGVEGVVFATEVSWDKDLDITSSFQAGQELEALVVSKDGDLGRLTLSLRRLAEDPFEKIAEKYQTDDVVRGRVVEVSANGTLVKLNDDMEGFVPSSKIEQGVNYNIGEENNFLVGSVDKDKRRINLAPFLTTTKGLIYK